MNRRSAIRLIFTSSGAGLFVFNGRSWGQQQDPQQGSKSDPQQTGQSPKTPDQTPSTTPEQGQDFTIRSESRLVLLDVAVRDKSGQFVPDLKKENFTVLEDGKKQAVTDFEGYDVPVTVGILVDESGSMDPKRREVLTAAMTFIGQSNPKDEIFILNFNDAVQAGLPPDVAFSDNIDQLRAALDLGVAKGRTALYDAVMKGLQKLEAGKQGKKALLLISDGGDTASEHRKPEMLEAVQSSIATIYTVGIYDADDQDRDPGVLKEIAHISGGGAFFPQTVAETVPVCRAIAKEMRSRYTIGYIPQAGNGSAKIRRLQVLVSGEGHEKLTAHTRTSYRYVDDTSIQAKR